MKSMLNALQEGRLIELPDTDKEKSLKLLAHLIEAIPDLGGNPELEEAMLARERVQNTALGVGVACPHVRAASGSGGELLCAVGWTPAGIDYGAPDGKKVHLVVMYYIPDSQKGTYLKEVSALANAIRKEGGIQSIASAEDLGSVRERLLDWVQAAIDASVPEAKARMIRLEARQAAVEAAPSGAPGAVQVLPLTVVTLPERHIVLCANRELAELLERDETLPAALKAKTQFNRGGYQLVFRCAADFDSRSLYEYLAVKAG